MPSYLVNEHKQLNQVWKKLEGAIIRGPRLRPGWMEQPGQLLPRGAAWPIITQGEAAAKCREFGFLEGSGDGAIPTASHTEAHADPITAFQLEDRVWYLSLGPAAVQLKEVAKTWTGPWILEDRVAPDL